MTHLSSSAAALAAYQSVSTRGSVESEDPHHLIELLLDAALARIAKAKGAIQRSRVAERGETLSEAITIIATLRDSLDMSKGGNLAENLDELYDYMQRKLAFASAHSKIETLDEVMSLLNELRSAWKQIPHSVRTRAQ